MFLAVLFWNLGWGNSSPLPGSVALCPCLGEQGLPSKWLVEHKSLSPRTKSGLFTRCVSICIIMKWVSSFLMPWGLGQIILLLSFPQIIMGGPTLISPSLMREWKKNVVGLFLYVYFFFGLSYLEVFLYKNTFKCNLLPWVKFISSSAEMLYKCGALTVVFQKR